MNSNFIIFILILVILYLYSQKSGKCNQSQYTKKIKPSEFNPAIHHPAAL